MKFKLVVFTTTSGIAESVRIHTQTNSHRVAETAMKDAAEILGSDMWAILIDDGIPIRGLQGTAGKPAK